MPDPLKVPHNEVRSLHSIRYLMEAVMEACPFCRTNIQPDATVCPGCGAELHVGPSKEMTGFMSIVCGVGAAYLSHQTGIFEHSTFFVVLAGFFFGVFLSKILFSDNRVWKRISRTTR